MGPTGSVYWGLAQEIVYDTDALDEANQNDYLSLLEWELHPVVLIGIDTRWNSGRRFGLDLDLQVAIPGLPVGQMQDYDWLLVNQEWTHWSLSDVWLRWGFIFDYTQDWRILQSRNFSMNLGFGYHMDWWAWRDRVVDSVYSTMENGGYRDTEIDNAYYGQNGINYDVAYHILATTLSMKLTGKVLFGEVLGRIGPILAFAHDHHKFRELHFYDSAFGFPWVDVSVVFGLQTPNRFSIHLSGEYAWMTEIQGNSMIYQAEEEYYAANDAAGFAFSRLGLKLGCSWIL